MSETCETLIERLHEREERAENEFDLLVGKVVGGNPPALERIEAILVAAGKSAADLDVAVQRQRRASDLQRVVDECSAEIESQTARMGHLADESDRLHKEQQAAIERFRQSTNAFTEAHAIRQNAHARRAAAEAELRQLQEPAA